MKAGALLPKNLTYSLNGFKICTATPTANPFKFQILHGYIRRVAIVENEHSVNIDQKLTHQWEVINHINDLIQAADHKAEISLATVGIIAAFLFTSAFELARSPGYSTLVNELGFWATFFLIAGVIALCFSSGCAFLCLTARTGVHPRLKKLLEPTINRPSTTLVFFGVISQSTREEYISAVTQCSDNEALTDLAAQTHVLSCIVSEKYHWINKMYIGLGTVLICFLLLALATLTLF